VPLQTYCSPLRYQHGGFGVANTGTALSLRNKLVAASAQVDTFCNASLLPDKHDFRGGSVTDENHVWKPPTPLLNEPGARRVFLNHRPIRTVTAFSIEYTNTYSMSLTPDQMMVNPSGGFIEIVASQPTIIGYPPLGFWFGLYEPFTLTSYTYGWQFASPGDVLEAVSPNLYMASHGSWLEGGDVTVTIDGAEIDPTDYTVNTDDGTVSFADSVDPDPDQVATASYTYTLPSAIETATAIIATDSFGQTRLSERGMLGLQSIRVADVALTAMSPSQMGYVTKNGVSIPGPAAALLTGFAIGSVA
jgi:hypothetical protein